MNDELMEAISESYRKIHKKIDECIVCVRNNSKPDLSNEIKELSQKINNLEKRLSKNEGLEVQFDGNCDLFKSSQTNEDCFNIDYLNENATDKKSIKNEYKIPNTMSSKPNTSLNKAKSTALPINTKPTTPKNRHVNPISRTTVIKPDKQIRFNKSEMFIACENEMPHNDIK
ncbi:hypothetical protein ECANGB1_1437 [Enterospora canceri]|uniref:Uncharacterized protein n=1 Tax=Enterospora canceri TaxID=1081671 RepID=A0A1Y1S605_9MICR|nr:hypothetical protein ECANGB1_1437 [Enterospora canceri]